MLDWVEADFGLIHHLAFMAPAGVQFGFGFGTNGSRAGQGSIGRRSVYRAAPDPHGLLRFSRFKMVLSGSSGNIDISHFPVPCKDHV